MPVRKDTVDSIRKHVLKKPPYLFSILMRINRNSKCFRFDTIHMANAIQAYDKMLMTQIQCSAKDFSSVSPITAGTSIINKEKIINVMFTASKSISQGS